MLRGRDREQAARTALELMDSRGWRWACLQEARGYVHQLRKLAGDRYDVIAPQGADSIIVVRADEPHGPGRRVLMSQTGWFTVRGGYTGPMYATTVLLTRAGVRLLSVHPTPSVNWRGGVIFGPIRRVVSMRRFARSVVRFAKSHSRPLIVAGDWNATPRDRGRFTPHWITRQTGMRLVAPDRATHGREVIDYAIVRGVTVAGVPARRLDKLGSDHAAVQIQVSR